MVEDGISYQLLFFFKLSRKSLQLPYHLVLKSQVSGKSSSVKTLPNHHADYNCDSGFKSLVSFSLFRYINCYVFKSTQSSQSQSASLIWGKWFQDLCRKQNKNINLGTDPYIKLTNRNPAVGSVTCPSNPHKMSGLVLNNHDLFLIRFIHSCGGKYLHGPQGLVSPGLFNRISLKNGFPNRF